MPHTNGTTQIAEEQVVMEAHGKPLVEPNEVAKPSTLERHAFVHGLFKELEIARSHYTHLTGELLELQARIMIAERNLRLTREHLEVVLSTTVEEVPKNWRTTLRQVRFVGVRLGDACAEIVIEKKRITTGELVTFLNNGQFRFRTGTPLKEITAALLRQKNIHRDGEFWVYTDPGAKQKKGGS